jgi:hypothetical protein
MKITSKIKYCFLIIAILISQGNAFWLFDMLRKSELSCNFKLNQQRQKLKLKREILKTLLPRQGDICCQDQEAVATLRNVGLSTKFCTSHIIDPKTLKLN